MREFNGLKPLPGTVSCPNDNGAQVLALLSYPNRHHLVTISVGLSGCAAVTNGTVRRAAVNIKGRNAEGPKLLSDVKHFALGKVFHRAPETSGVVVAASPSGPPVPPSGWRVVFADGFGGKLHDRTLGVAEGADNEWLFAGGQGCVGDGNQNAVERFCPNMVSQRPDGLHLTAAYTPSVAPCTYAWGACNYTSGRVLTNGDTPPTTGFSWRLGGGETWALQIVTKFAPQFDGGPLNGGNDEGFWGSGGPPLASWSQEFDVFEHWGWVYVPSHAGETWVYQTNPFQVVDVISSFSLFCGCDPAAAFHTYTAVIDSNNSFAWYMDGRLIGAAPSPPTLKRVWMKLALSYALRINQGNPDPVPGFSTPGQSRDWVIRSVAVYQDGADAGRDIQNGGIAPGTRVQR